MSTEYAFVSALCGLLLTVNAALLAYGIAGLYHHLRGV